MLPRSAGLFITTLLVAAGVPAAVTAQENGTLFPSLTLPETGDSALHIISPDILELVRINTKPAGTATVPDSWNFVSSG
ncbi:MAG: hypothetical protein JWM59_3037, partial [Verrucomicrobiales bacterium]|nr:hypothetical protein [Verrucomicrobiales bacterium]